MPRDLSLVDGDNVLFVPGHVRRSIELCTDIRDLTVDEAQSLKRQTSNEWRELVSQLPVSSEKVSEIP